MNVSGKTIYDLISEVFNWNRMATLMNRWQELISIIPSYLCPLTPKYSTYWQNVCQLSTLFLGPVSLWIIFKWEIPITRHYNPGFCLIVQFVWQVHAHYLCTQISKSELVLWTHPAALAPALCVVSGPLVFKELIKANEVRESVWWWMISVQVLEAQILQYPSISASIYSCMQKMFLMEVQIIAE